MGQRLRGKRGLRREGVSLHHFASTRNGKHKLGGAKQAPNQEAHV